MSDDLPSIHTTRTRLIAGLGFAEDDETTPLYSIYQVFEMYDPESSEGWERVSVQGVLDDISEEQARELSIQLARATGLSAEHDIAIGILKAQLQEAQDGLRAITQILEANT